ncbi:HAD-IIIA family hydrolase [Selenomonas sp. KH1T6]|uniref:HAD-IIIA family hydrolase n=1 Tax=Selenomonas sp. KH1T6 TaxID=3158784 RepID=UPI0008A7804E|nr:D,D-heptose 1,7-bisphosphate phosphatase [Selenomonas ruminantium]
MTREYTAVIQAGGKGTRMRELTGDRIPKPMLELGGKPMIQWQVENLKKYGIREFVFIIGHLGEKVKDYFGDGTAFGVHISYVEENEPLGSGGALCYLKDMVGASDVLLVFGDVMFDIDAPRLLGFHEEKQAGVTLLVHPNAHPQDSDLVVMDENSKVLRFDFAKNQRDYYYDNCVNAGIYVLANEVIKSLGEPAPLDLEKELFRSALEDGKIYGYRTTEYVKDAGTPKRFRAVERELLQGVWQSRNLESPQKCVFLDRDGTLNIYKGLISSPEELELEAGVAEAIALLNAAGYLAIIVTNQPVVARGLCSMEEVREIHKKLSVLLGEQGAYLDDMIFCPHHPDKGYPEENPAYKIPCHCRKPDTGMVEEMAEKHHVDIKSSWFVGDTTVDIKTGQNAGLHTALVKTGEAGKDGKYEVQAELEAENLLDAVKKILAERKPQ